MDKSAPLHIAIIMDGNRRWAKKSGLPSAVGHASGAKRVRSIVHACADRGVRFITLFVFSTENWQRPQDEVSGLMGLLALYLKKEIADMNAKGVRLRVVGDTAGFDAKIQSLIGEAEQQTAHNTTITLTVAANYGGQWDIVRGVKSWQRANPGKSVESMNESALSAHLSMSYAPNPDLLIRTGGESRVSNFMLWQLAYAELYFTDVLWPDFTVEMLDQAIGWYGARDRRFGGSGLTLST
jgi:undecaprenyl diphosphate synthase